jgi:hypothetical protein
MTGATAKAGVTHGVQAPMILVGRGNLHETICQTTTSRGFVHRNRQNLCAAESNCHGVCGAIAVTHLLTGVSIPQSLTLG